MSLRPAYWTALFCFLSASFLAGQTLQDGFVVRTDAGTIDWGTGEVLVTGTARVRQVVKNPSDTLYDAEDPFQPRSLAGSRILAKREAEERARVNAEALFSSLRVNNGKTVADFMKLPGVNAKVNAFIADSGRLSSAVLSDGVYTVTLSYSLFGSKGFLALNDEDDPEDDFIRFRTEAWPVFAPLTNRTVWEGLVISAPYLKLSPALAPRIFAENGTLLYDASFISSADAAENGMARYAVTPFHVLKTVNTKYYHCLALNTTTFQGTDLVITDEDAARIASSPVLQDHLKKCRLIILAAPPARQKR